MKILHIIAGMDPRKGGVGQAVRTMVASLAELGVESETVCLDGPESAFLRDDDFTIHALGPGKGPWCYAPALLPWLTGNLGRFNAVIVHGLWLSHGFMIRKAMINLALNNKNNGRQSSVIPKLFIMPHGMLDPYFQKAKGRKLKAMRNWIYWKLIEGKVVNEADGVFFTCEDERKLAHEPFQPYQPKKEMVVGLGVLKPPPYNDSMKEAFLKSCPQVRSDSYIIFLGRVHEKKGVDLLVQAYAKLISENKYENLLPKLVIAGPGIETLYGQKIQHLISGTQKLADYIFFPGMLTGAAKWGALYGSNAFILPSHQENFGIAVVEALACGKAVLISDKVNIWREIESGGGGVVRNDTIEGTLQMLEFWKGLPIGKKQAMSNQAKGIYESCFTVKSVTHSLIQAMTQ